MEKIIDKIIKISLYSLVFLLPLFFLPLTIFPTAWNKQILLAGVCFLISVLWLAKIIKLGKVELVWGKLSWAVLILLVVFGISTLFSMAMAQSFWGTSVKSDSFFNFVLYGLAFFLFSNLISKQEVSKVIKIFLSSSAVLALLFLIQEIFGSIFSWNFAKVSGFNPVGSVQVLAAFLGGGLVILITLLMINKGLKEEKISAYIVGGLLLVSIFLINSWIVWVGLAFSMIIILWIKLKSIKKIEIKDYILPLVIFAIALALLFIKLPLGDILDLPAEVNLNYKASFNIAQKTLGEGFKNFIFGSGPATFVHKYSLHRSISPNLTIFWNTRFEQAQSALITFLATSGILGLLAILFLIIIFFYQGFKRLSKNKTQIVVFVGGAYFLILWIFYSINFSLMFAGFLIMGLWIASSEQRKEISLVDPPQRAFFSMLGAVVLMVVLIAGFYVYTQQYSAALSFAKGIELSNAEQPDLNGAIAKVATAASTAKTNDGYLRNLSQIFLLKIIRQENLQISISSAKKAIEKAIDINPKNSSNWVQAGRVYEKLISLDNEAKERAIVVYQKAAELDPQNPQISLNLGRTYKTIAQMIQENFNSLTSAEKRDKNKQNQFRNAYVQALALAEDNLQKSIELKNNFASAYYLLAQVYEMAGSQELAIQNYKIVLQLEPENEEARERLERLR